MFNKASLRACMRASYQSASMYNKVGDSMTAAARGPLPSGAHGGAVLISTERRAPAAHSDFCDVPPAAVVQGQNANA